MTRYVFEKVTCRSQDSDVAVFAPRGIGAMRSSFSMPPEERDPK